MREYSSGSSSSSRSTKCQWKTHAASAFMALAPGLISYFLQRSSNGHFTEYYAYLRSCGQRSELLLFKLPALEVSLQRKKYYLINTEGGKKIFSKYLPE